MTPLDKAPDWSGKMRRPFRQSARKAAVLTGLLVALMVPWIKIVFAGQLPSEAAAAPVGGSSAAAVDSENPRASTRQSESFRQWAGRPVVPLSRNFFAVRPEN